MYRILDDSHFRSTSCLSIRNLSDDSSLTAEGIGRVVLRDHDGREIMIEEVLYVPWLKTNLLNLSQLL